jgi:two-component system response regulator AtoC
MLSHHWPGNVRELENFVRKFLILREPDALARDLRAKIARKSMICPAIPDMYAAPAHQIAERPILEQVTRAKRQAETEAILATLNSTRWNRKQAAVLLKIDYKALLYKMKKLGIEDTETQDQRPDAVHLEEQAWRDGHQRGAVSESAG